MTMEQIVADHYSSIEVDDAACVRLGAMIATLAGDDHAPATPRRITPGFAAAAAVAAALVGVIGNGAVSQNRADTYVAVDSHGTDGVVRGSDLADVTARRSDQQVGTGQVTVVLSLFGTTDRRVIGSWSPTGASLRIRCPHADGVAFEAPAAGRTGDPTPVDAARDLDRDLGLAGFGDDDATWTVRSRTATAATLTTATTTLYAGALPDGTWVITGGRRCES